MKNIGWFIVGLNPIVTGGPGTIGEMPSVGDLFNGSWPIFKEVSGKTMENSNWLGQQAQLGIDPCHLLCTSFECRTPPSLVGWRQKRPKTLPGKKLRINKIQQTKKKFQKDYKIMIRNILKVLTAKEITIMEMK